MAGATRVLASAAVGGVLVVWTAGAAAGQTRPASPASAPAVRPATSPAPGSLAGVVRDERGLPVPNVVVSALGAVTTIAVTDSTGHYEFGALTPGPYLVRAHLAGFIAPRAQMVQVRTGAGVDSPIALRREGSVPVLAAGLGGTELAGVSLAPPATPASASGSDTPPAAPAPVADDGADTHTDTAWRIRHARRSVLKDAQVPEQWLAGTRPDEGGSMFGRAVDTSTRLASLFADAPLSGQVNLLTSGSFDTPQQLFSTDSFARNVANIRLGSPAGSRADWSVTGALNQADVSSWIVAGAYSTHAPARHRYDLGVSYSTQRYDGGNPLALRDVTDGSRNVGTLYGFDSITLSPELTVTAGAEYARYDYLKERSLFSPRVDVTFTPATSTRVSVGVSQRAQAPGAEEFLPPGDSGIWLPPQRTFSSLSADHAFRAERTLGATASLEHDLGSATLAVRGFRQRVSDQLVTVFGADVPGQPVAKVGHYQVGDGGDFDAAGVSAEFRAVIASRVHGSVQYAMARGRILRTGDDYLMLLAPVARDNPATIHDVTARVETQVPETATRVVVLYRVGNGFARAGAASGEPGRTIDSRFDVQVRQSLPFMNFSNARWEMLLAVRNFFRDSACDQSLFDELLVVRPPKRVVGGVTLHF